MFFSCLSHIEEEDFGNRKTEFLKKKMFLSHNFISLGTFFIYLLQIYMIVTTKEQRALFILRLLAATTKIIFFQSHF